MVFAKRTKFFDEEIYPEPRSLMSGLSKFNIPILRRFQSRWIC